MKKSLEAMEKIIQSIVENGGKMDVNIDFETGTLVINGVELTLEDQHELMFTVDSLSGKGTGIDLGKILKDSLSAMGETGFNLFDDIVHLPKQSLGESWLDNIVQEKIRKQNAEQESEELNKLRAENEALRQEIKLLKRKTPLFPDDFEKIDGGEDVSNRLDVDDIQKLVDDVAYMEVPLYSFASSQLGDTIVLKIHDDEGIHLIVASDYYIRKLDR